MIALLHPKRMLAVLLALCVAACAQDAPRGPVVLAAASMQEALETIADSWAAEGHARPVLSFSSSPSVARQVAEGAPADVIITADAEWMDWLEERDLLRPGSRSVIAGNSLVVVRTRGAGDRNLANLGNEPIALGDPAAVPAGRYAKAALESLGLWEGLEDQVIPAENVRAALALVERGEVSLGIVYASDALASGRVEVTERLDPASHPAILYPAAVTANSQNGDAADFVAYLTAPEARAILAAHGFEAIP